MKRTLLWIVLLALAISAVGCGQHAPSDYAQAAAPDNVNPQPPAEPGQLPFSQSTDKKGIEPQSLLPTVVVPSGTVISIRLQSSVSSATAHAGDTFDAELDDPIVLEGRTIAPRGAPARGRVLAARQSGRLHNSGYLRIALTSVTLNGREFPVQTSSVSASGGAHKNRNLAMIGGGAGAGTLIGAIAGGGKGALIGGLVGAGAGTGTAYATGKKDVAFGVERRLSFRTTEAITVK